MFRRQPRCYCLPYNYKVIKRSWNVWKMHKHTHFIGEKMEEAMIRHCLIFIHDLQHVIDDSTSWMQQRIVHRWIWAFCTKKLKYTLITGRELGWIWMGWRLGWNVQEESVNHMWTWRDNTNHAVPLIEIVKRSKAMVCVSVSVFSFERVESSISSIPRQSSVHSSTPIYPFQSSTANHRHTPMDWDKRPDYSTGTDARSDGQTGQTKINDESKSVSHKSSSSSTTVIFHHKSFEKCHTNDCSAFKFRTFLTNVITSLNRLVAAILYLFFFNNGASPTGFSVMITLVSCVKTCCCCSCWLWKVEDGDWMEVDDGVVAVSDMIVFLLFLLFAEQKDFSLVFSASVFSCIFPLASFVKLRLEKRNVLWLWNKDWGVFIGC